jgi:hypothetical protein
MVQKIPKTWTVFGTLIRAETKGPDVITFYYPDYTVGFGITPNHARFCGTHFPKGKLSLPKEARGLYHRSGIQMRMAQMSPCPEGIYSVFEEDVML